MRVGLISDTHGYLDPRALAALAGVDVILHAGDVGSPAIIEALSTIAPVHAVRGNNDEKLGGLGLPFALDLTLEGHSIHLIHQIADARPGPETRAVVAGHSHRAVV